MDEVPVHLLFIGYSIPKSQFVFYSFGLLNSRALAASIALDPRADEELVDQKKYLEEACKPKCVKPLIQYQSCIKRIKDDESGHKHCTGQYFDYWSCIDHCVAPRLFEKI
ncbi:Ubiquinol-cytochrome C reductase hinge domain, partial [Dillenia turbinata]